MIKKFGVKKSLAILKKMQKSAKSANYKKHVLQAEKLVRAAAKKTAKKWGGHS